MAFFKIQFFHYSRGWYCSGADQKDRRQRDNFDAISYPESSGRVFVTVVDPKNGRWILTQFKFPTSKEIDSFLLSLSPSLSTILNFFFRFYYQIFRQLELRLYCKQLYCRGGFCFNLYFCVFEGHQFVSNFQLHL